MSEARLRSPSPWPQDVVMPNRDIIAQAPGESESARSEPRCDEHHADRIMQESLAAAGREFFHALRAHIGCDGKKAGPTPCSAIWVPKSEPHLPRSEEHTSELQSHLNLVCRLLLEKKKN